MGINYLWQGPRLQDAFDTSTKQAGRPITASVGEFFSFIIAAI